MYNDRETLLHHNRLLSPSEAAADLRLLEQKSPNHPRLGEFRFSPRRYASDILMELLKVASTDEIIMNRLRKDAKTADTTETTETTDAPETTDASETTDVPPAPKAKKEKKKASKKK